MPDEYKPEDPGTERDDALLRNIFANVGKRKDPPQDKLDRWGAVFRAELGHKILARKQRRLYVGAGAAAVLMLVGLAQLMIPQTNTAPVVATVVVDKNGNKLFRDRQAIPVHVRLEIKVGDTLLTGSHGYLTLAYRGADIRLRADTSLRFHATKLELLVGGVYVDTHNEAGIKPGSVVVSTSYGAFTHLGTQFLVETSKDGVLAAVREGAIIGPNNTTLNAARGARQLRVDASGVQATDAIDSHGGVWRWVSIAAPALVASNANAHQVLRWATRELGLDLNYTPGAEAYAMRETVNGEIEVEDVIGVLSQSAPGINIEQTDSRWLVSLRGNR
ncbi:MAG: FecR family protein [Gammaproteobacteria bacterium]|nr:FecR family protein [Gammaproteobacteria bacterium]